MNNSINAPELTSGNEAAVRERVKSLIENGIKFNDMHLSKMTSAAGFVP